MIDVHITNNTTHSNLVADVVAKVVEPTRTMIHLRVSQPAGDPVAKELDSLKKVMHDLLQERVVGLKVYSVLCVPFEDGDRLLGTIYLNFEDAKKAAELDAEGELDLGGVWEVDVWLSNVWHCGHFTIREHQIG